MDEIARDDDEAADEGPDDFDDELDDAGDLDDE
jgi:hypothetical protein